MTSHHRSLHRRIDDLEQPTAPDPAEQLAHAALLAGVVPDDDAAARALRLKIFAGAAPDMAFDVFLALPDPRFDVVDVQVHPALVQLLQALDAALTTRRSPWE
jgi:hypothetical protein